MVHLMVEHFDSNCMISLVPGYTMKEKITLILKGLWLSESASSKSEKKEVRGKWFKPIL